MTRREQRPAAEARERIGDRDVVVSVSGGKDSAAASLHLADLGIPHLRVYMDTGWEWRGHYEYLDLLEERLGPIIRLRQPVPVLEGYEAEVAELEAIIGVESPMVRLCVWKGCFPGQASRWCTGALKTIPFARWAVDRDEMVNVVGIRREESTQRANALEWEEMGAVETSRAGAVARLPDEPTRWDLSHVEQWRPLVDWTVGDVVACLERHRLPMHPLYRLGAERVGCWPCIFAANKAGLRHFADIDPERIEVLRRLEAVVERRWRERIEARGDEADRPPTWFQARDPVAIAEWMREHPDDGNGPRRHLCLPIDRALEWANTAHGGRQALLFAPPHRDWACSRYGFCDIGPGPKP